MKRESIIEKGLTVRIPACQNQHAAGSVSKNELSYLHCHIAALLLVLTMGIIPANAIEIESMSMDSTVTGYISAYNTEDWYEVYLTQEGFLNVKLKIETASTDLDLKIYDANNELIGNSTGYTNVEQSFVYIPSSGYYYIKVYSYKAGGQSRYTLQNQFYLDINDYVQYLMKTANFTD